MEDYHLHSLADDLGVSLADAQSGPVVPCRGQADRRVVEPPGQETRQRQRRPGLETGTQLVCAVERC